MSDLGSAVVGLVTPNGSMSTEGHLKFDRDSLPIDTFLSAVSVLVVTQPSSEDRKDELPCIYTYFVPEILIASSRQQWLRLRTLQLPYTYSILSRLVISLFVFTFHIFFMCLVFLSFSSQFM
jgi:hypothetical protein